MSATDDKVREREALKTLRGPATMPPQDTQVPLTVTVVNWGVSAQEEGGGKTADQRDPLQRKATREAGLTPGSQQWHLERG